MYSVEELCGLKEGQNNFKTISSDGSFVFENDPGFDSLTITNLLNQTITVNSFDECEHYVLGGWNSSQSMNLEFLSQYVLLTFLFIVIFRKIFIVNK